MAPNSPEKIASNAEWHVHHLPTILKDVEKMPGPGDVHNSLKELLCTFFFFLPK